MLAALRYGFAVSLLSYLGVYQSVEPPTGNTTPPAAESTSTQLASSASKDAPAVTNFLGEGRDLYRKGDFDGAIAKYQQFVQAHPKSPDGYTALARVYLRQKKVAGAADMVTQGLKQSDSARLHVALGEVLFRQGKISEAEQEWVKVIQSGYPDARAYWGLSRVRNALAMYATGKKMIDKAHEIDPNDPDIEEDWTATLSRKDRVKYLEAGLAGSNNWNAKERESASGYLNYLRERMKGGQRGCRLVSPVTATEMQMVRLLHDPTHLRGYGLPVDINGHKSNLLIDTGASGIIVSRHVADRAGITNIVSTKASGIGDKGPRNASIAMPEHIRIGQVEFENCPVEVIENGNIAEGEGLMGSNVLHDFLIDLDFPHEKLKLSELPKRPGEEADKPVIEVDGDDDSGGADASQSQTDDKDAKPASATTASRWHDRYIAPEMKSYTQVYRFGHHVLVPTNIGDVPAKLFLLDTGAFSNTLSPAAAREVTKVENDASIVRGLSGSVKKVYSAKKAVLQFGNLRQENQDIITFDTSSVSDSAGTEVSGFLGFALLRLLDIKIDYRDNLVKFSFDADNWGM